MSKCFSGLPQKNAEHVRGFSSTNSWGNNSQMNTNSHGFNPDAQRNPNPSSQNDAETRKSSTPMDYVRGILEMDGNGVMGDHRFSGPTIEHDADFVHIKLLRNNTFVTVTDNKGNIKLNASAGCLKEMKGGQKLSRYAAEATAEEVGRRARKLGLKSVVMKVKGLTYFKKKRQAIVSWREGFTESKSICPIVYIEDATRRPHNGCRRPKRRRI
ncbi:putative ribosomal protein S11, mitochondrial [Senna tora]|uniref:Putative ribosomal protein S11, mitochondrial n=1 Tax=Senna tora TaxID=362788 RepID=A0A834TSW2_9FABA|nr:putative ribosomal protein S11, mitochondrial [Senna tora]